MKAYYTSRIIISLAFAVLQWATGAIWWEAALIAAVLIALFMWAPRSGRYAVYPELGVSALRRDEFTQAINDKAARNAFMAMALAVSGYLIIVGGVTAVPIQFVKWLLFGGIGVYYLSDFWLRGQRLIAKPQE